MGKVAIFLHATENELGRAIHSLVYTQDLHNAGHKVKLIFDGQGVLWVGKLQDPNHQINPLFNAVKKLGVIEACGHCADAFNVTDNLKQAEIAFSEGIDSEGHTNIADLVTDGWQIITL